MRIRIIIQILLHYRTQTGEASMLDSITTYQVEWALIVPLLSIMAFLVYGWHENASRTDETDRLSRLPLYNKTLVILWGLAAICLAGWVHSGRTIDTLGLSWPEPGWRGWLAWSLVALTFGYYVYISITLASSASARQQVRAQLSGAKLDFMRPRTTAEHTRFKLLSVTAGVTEEIIFRGFLIAILSLFMPLVFAAILAILLFGIGHIYQGLAGVIQTSLIGGILAAIYLVGGSLWPAILVHVLIDMIAGTQFQLIDRFESVDCVTEA